MNIAFFHSLTEVSMRNISLVLCFSLLLGGCSSYFQITEEEKTQLLHEPKETVQITLTDGNEVVAKPYHYIQVAEPSDFVLGAGELWNVRTNSRTSFHGKIQPQRIDSGGSNVQGGWTYYDFWISESTKVRFQKDEFITVKHEDGVGLFVGTLGTISPERIKTVKQEKISGVKTILLVVGGAAVLGVTAVLVLFAISPPGH